MDVGNVLQNCSPAYRNTGYNKSCFTEFGAPVGIIFTQFGQTFTTASLSALKTALTTGILADLPYQRIYPVQDIVDIVDGSEKPVIVTNNLGGKKKVRDGFTDLMLGWWNGGFCLLYALRQMNGNLMPFLIVTNKGILVGTDAGPGLMKGITGALVDAEPFTWSDGSKLNAYNLHLNWDPKQTNENVKFADFNGIGGGGLAYLSGLTGLENILLSKIARVVALCTVGLTTGCGGINLFDVYPTQLVAGLWVAYANNAGVPDYTKPIAITSVTPVPATKGYAIQLNAADANYTGNASGPVWITLTGPTELQAAGIGGTDGSSGFEAQIVSVGL